tara:strand:- start:40 stop:261 length:222 start_codon:yes stop_codon:yes gene_type:complete
MKFNKLEKPVTMKVYTKKPSKWILVDQETGQVYRGNENLANKEGHNGWEKIEENMTKEEYCLKYGIDPYLQTR